MEFLNKMLQKTPSGYDINPETAKAAHTIADVLGIKEEKVDSVLLAGIPMMTAVAAADPLITDRLFLESKKQGRQKAKHRKYAVKDYFAMFGDKGRPMTQAVAAETGASEGDVNGVLALYLPTFVDAIEAENPPNDEALADLFHADAEEATSESPAFAGMVKKIDR